MRIIAMLFSLAFMPLFFQSSFGQCIPAPPPPASCTGAEPQVVNNEILLKGVQKWYSGPAATLGQVTLRGGTLIVCTDLTINALAMDSGTVIVAPGARLTTGNSSGFIWRGGCAFYNYGRFELTTHLSLEGPYTSATRPNIYMNASTASSCRSFNYVIINDPYSYLVNYGQADFHGIITDNFSKAGCVCLGPSSELRQSVIINKVKNTYQAPSGSACMAVWSSSQLVDTVTKDHTLLLCLGTGHSSLSGGSYRPNAWGAATVFKACNSCVGLALLPVAEKPSGPAGRDLPPAEPVRTFPNPFTTVVQISWLPGKKPQAIIILNSMGQIIYTCGPGIGSSNKMSITLPAALPEGTYIAKIVYPEQAVVQRLIKKWP